MEAFWRLGAGGSRTWLAGHLVSFCRSYPCTTGDLNSLYYVHEIMQVFFIPLEQLSGAHDRVDLFTEIAGSQLGPQRVWMWICTPFGFKYIISGRRVLVFRCAPFS